MAGDAIVVSLPPASDQFAYSTDSVVTTAMYDDVSGMLDLIEKSQRIQRDDIKAVGENNMDMSERVLANFATARTVSDGSATLARLLADPTQWQTQK